jgi:1,4-alpha-glucan branching enzyme
MQKESGLIAIDPWLSPYNDALNYRVAATESMKEKIAGDQPLANCSVEYNFFGLHKNHDDSWTFREWAPAATSIYLLCDANNWRDDSDYSLKRTKNNVWEITIPAKALKHKSQYKLHMFWEGGDGFRVPAFATRVVQDEKTHIFNAQVWDPVKKFQWNDSNFEPNNKTPLIYEAHVGMSGEQEKVTTYSEFTKDILPYVKKSGYNTIQLMAIQEHPYYGSFGYHVSSFYAASSRFGTPDDLKKLINTAHKLGIAIIIDLVHSHAVRNEVEGLSRFDGTYYQYFHDGGRGNHPAWDSRCFDYGKPEVARFLLSNCRFWIDEYHVDGFRFDGITSMLYRHHGLEKDFTHYDQYFSDIDQDAISYLTLANQLIHEIKPSAITVAEEVSGMPGVAAATTIGGLGFDYRLSMGTPDMWIKLIKEKSDEDWSVSSLFHELTQHRPEEKTINYVESHDQALVGDKTVIFRLMDKEMYYHMTIGDNDMTVERGIALHKMIRLITASTNSGGFLAFMGNEFGHPEWIDFPRAGNDWSYKYARRQWSLVNNKELKYKWLYEFDKAMIAIISKTNGYVSYVSVNEGDHVVSFCRGNFLFVFNFHPSIAYTDYGVPVPAGTYDLVLSSDYSEFGGFNRISGSAPYLTTPVPNGNNLRVYMPPRTAAVFKINS